ncbi:MAG: HAMP domain-containing histidine kinase [Nitrospirae bacterium]|nr:HAMP domain-containing histidine kinase [Nitrospirota bacterium]
MNNAGANEQTVTCSHRGEGKSCPISKTPCLGECIYANILDDINLGIIGFDISKKEVFFQNKLAVEIFKGTIQPKDYEALVSLLLSDIEIPFLAATLMEPRTIRYGNKFIGYTIYLISDTYLWVYVTDITEKTRLQAIAEAVNTMDNLGYIFSGIRHELGNPINSIKTTLAVCKKNLAAYSKEAVNEFLDRMLSDIGRVEVLLKDLKNFSMYENPECREVHIASFMNNLLAMVERDFSTHKIRIKTFYRPDAEYGLFDPRALQHVMLNVLTNASDALQDIESPEIMISTLRSDSRLVIRIRDNGCGMPEEQKKHLFQPFSTTKSHGTGLGLVIIKKMMFKMNGTVEVESQEGIGTIVILSLPISQSCNA